MRNDNDGAERAESTNQEQARSASPELGSHGSFHTPGPWKHEGSGDWVSAHDAQMKVCDIRGWGYLTGVGGLDLGSYDAEEIQKANANLIAAAPDLYAALIRARGALKAMEDITGTWALYQHSPEMRAINAAIAKAEGRV